MPPRRRSAREPKPTRPAGAAAAVPMTEADLELPELAELAPLQLAPDGTDPREARIAANLAPSVALEDVLRLIRTVTAVHDAPIVGEGLTLDATGPAGTAGYTCLLCGNTNQTNFVADPKSGDTICRGREGNDNCGNVVQDHRVHEGSAYRKFEGEEDKSHHGKAPNPLFSSAENFRTAISKLGNNANNLRKAAAEVEMNLSQIGKDERKTRVGYKDRKKKEAFEKMRHIAANLDLHETVVARAERTFAGFRDLRESVHHEDAVLAACLIYGLRTAKETGPSQAGAKAPQRVSQRQASVLRSDGQLHPFQCRKCDRRFNDQRSLRHHTCSSQAAPAQPKRARSKGYLDMLLEGGDSDE